MRKSLLTIATTFALALTLAGCANAGQTSTSIQSNEPAQHAQQESPQELDHAQSSSSSAKNKTHSATDITNTYPYTTQNRYDVEESMFARQDGVDYGTVEDISYHSATAGDEKHCNVLLPAGYDASKSYPVTYVIHGFWGDYHELVDNDTFLTLLYGNMLNQGLAEPQILVGVDMYTDVTANKESKTDEELRFIYDKVVDDIANDLMPVIEQRYAVRSGRENTAVAGISQGGAEALCCGFKYLDRIGYIGGFAPDTGVIPTQYYVGTFWNTPYFQEFPQPTESTMPKYVYLSVGTNDPYNVDCTRYYGEVLTKMGVSNQTDSVPGFEHDDLFWRQCFYNFLGKTFR